MHRVMNGMMHRMVMYHVMMMHGVMHRMMDGMMYLRVRKTA